MVPKRPETSSGCYKSQSFFFPKTSRNPTQPGNPKLNDTSSTPENKVDLKVSPNGLLQLNALQGCTPPSRSTEEGRLLSKPAFHPSSQPLLLLPASLFAFGRVRAAFHCCRLSGAPKMNYISFFGRLDGCEAPGNRLEGTREK